MTHLSIELVPCLSDNYAYLVHDARSGQCAVVDPSEAAPVEKALAHHGWSLTHVLNTHHHPDHTGGNLELKKRHGAVVVGPAKDAERIPGIDIGVSAAEPWNFAGETVRILEIPAHTRAHIAFIFEEEAAAFTGNTLFSMGCGRLFEGTPQMMWDALSKLMTLPDATQIYCGHEYTWANGRFALTLEPGNLDLHHRMSDVTRAREANAPTIPTNMGLEKRTNPFLRPDSAEIRKTLGMEDADNVAVFAEMRHRKDNFTA